MDNQPKRKWSRFLFTAWRGVGHISQVKEVSGWVRKAAGVIGLVVAVVSVEQAMWGAALAAGAAVLFLAFYSYFSYRPSRPLLRLHVYSIGPGARQDEKGRLRLGVLVFMEVTNLGRPTPLTNWSIVATLGGAEYPFITDGGPPITTVAPIEGGGSKELIVPGTSLVHVTAQPVGSAIVRGYVAAFSTVLSQAEFAFRWNTRSVDDGARTLAAIRGAEGKRLMYREPLGAKS